MLLRDGQVRGGMSHPVGFDVWDGSFDPLYQWWREGVDAGRLRGRQDLDPGRFTKLLPRLALIDVLQRDPLDLRYRLAGTEIFFKSGRDPTGKRFADIYSGPYLAEAFETYRGVIDSARPYTSTRTYTREKEGGFLTYKRLLLPLARDGETVDVVLLLVSDLQVVEG